MGQDAITWSRAEPRTLLPAALEMYRHGRTRSEVLEAIYGVDLPKEALLFLRDFVAGEKPLSGGWRFHPWMLMLPNEADRPFSEISSHRSAEEALAYALAPNVVLLGALSYAHTNVRLGGSLFGYDLDEVRAGRSTVVGLLNKREFAPGDRFSVLGPSLVDVFSETLETYLKLTEDQARRDRHEDVSFIREQLASIEELRREL